MKRIIISFVVLLFAVTAWSQSGSKTKSFSWQGLSMSYPDNYIITDKEYDRQDKSYTFICTTPEDGEACIKEFVNLGVEYEF